MSASLDSAAGSAQTATTSSSSSSSGPGGVPPLTQAQVEAVLQVCAEHSPVGATQDEVEAACSDLSRGQIGAVLNLLAKQHRIQFFGNPHYDPALPNHAIGPDGKKNAKMFFRANENADAARGTLERLHDLSLSHRHVYQLIEQSGNKGTWQRDLRFKAQLQHTEITKILKTLESRKLVKSVSSVAGRNRKAWLLFDLEPSPEVTGDVFYSGSSLDRQFIDVLAAFVHRHVAEKGFVSVNEVHEELSRVQISKQALTIDNVITILDVLMYQGKVERLSDEMNRDEWQYKAGDLHYRRNEEAFFEANGLTDAPCGTCPVVSECQIGGLVSPLTCPYISEYLDF